MDLSINYTIKQNLINFYTNRYINSKYLYAIINYLENNCNYNTDCVYIKKINTGLYNIIISIKNKYKFEYMINNIIYLFSNLNGCVYSSEIIKYRFYIDLLKNSFIDNKRKVIELKTDVYNYEYLCYNDITKSDESFLFYKYNSQNYKFIIKQLIKEIYKVSIRNVKYSITTTEFIVYAMFEK